jgi:hypothetical protein
MNNEQAIPSRTRLLIVTRATAITQGCAALYGTELRPSTAVTNPIVIPVTAPTVEFLRELGCMQQPPLRELLQHEQAMPSRTLPADRRLQEMPPGSWPAMRGRSQCDPWQRNSPHELQMPVTRSTCL